MPSSACKKQNIRSVCLPKPGFRRCRFYPFLTPNAPCEGLRRRGAGMCLAISTPAVLPSVGRKTSAPRTCLTPLNTSPAPSPVNASRLTSRAARASLGAGAVRYAFTVTDFHRPPLAGLPAHPPIHDLHDMDRLSNRYGVKIGELICQPGVRIPDPDWSSIERVKED